MSARAKREAEKANVSTERQLKIQLGILKRMVKETQSYEKEVVDNESRVQKMKDDGKDPYDIRKQEEVLAESHMMIPDSKNRLETTIDSLENFLVLIFYIAFLSFVSHPFLLFLLLIITRMNLRMRQKTTRLSLR
jgi:tubulin-specific chaperone A